MGKRLDTLRRALHAAPDDPKLLLEFARQALLARTPGEAAEAEGALRHLLELQPRHMDARLVLAEALLTLGKSSEAAVRAEELLSERPGLARAYLLLARVALREGDRAEAQKQWRRAQRADSALNDAEMDKEFGATARGVSRMTHDGVDWSSRSEDEDDEDETEFDEGFQVEDFNPAQATLADVAGLEAEAELLQRQLGSPGPELLAVLNNRPRGGVLLYGPPGCGKSLLAEAIAGTAGVPFLAVGLHQLLDSYVGNAEKNLHDLFELAAERGPCVLFFDELDAFAADRGQQRFTPTRTLLSQLLFELDRLSPQSGTLVIGATSSPWEMDGALLRAGRLGTNLFIGPPAAPARERLLRDAIETAFPDLLHPADPARLPQLHELVEATRGFASADLRHLVLQWLAATPGLGAAGATGAAGTEADLGQLLLAARSHHSEISAWSEEARAALAESAASRRRFPALARWLETQPKLID